VSTHSIKKSKEAILMIKITFPDGAVKEFDAGITTAEIAAGISKSLAKKALAGKVNGQLIDLNRGIEEDASIEIVTPDHEDALALVRHSTAHLMAQAMRRLYPNIHFGVGPAIDSGFYYDTDNGENQISAEDLPAIEAEMMKIVKENLPIERKVLSKEEALEIFASDPYKVELISELPDEEVITAYQQGEFIDLCRGPHVPSTGRIQVFKLLSVAGAYWRGNSNNQMMQRVYGTAFFDKKDLKEFIRLREEAKERDHRKLGKELDLFMVSPQVGSGLPFWLPKGATIRRTIERYIVDKEISLGYQHVYTPIMGDVELYKTSGHWDHYQEDMFPPMDMGDGEMLVLRPMNCPHHMMVYKNAIHSYRELPIRIAELGMMHRYEKSGALSGLQRVREMTLNDGHTFVRPDQIKDEFKRTLELMVAVYADFNITDYRFRLSYRDPNNTDKYFDDDAMWEKAQVIVSTMERFVAYLTEVYKGAFPTWLAPIQATIIPVSVEAHSDYAYEIKERLQMKGLRVEVDDRNEKMGYKIRASQTQKIPYQLVVGDKEVADATVNIRRYGSKETSVEDLNMFVDAMVAEVQNYSRQG